MFSLLVFTVVLAGCLAKPTPLFVFDSYSPAVGYGYGYGHASSFTTGGHGRITGIRVWDISYRAIYGIQLRHNDKWDSVVGHAHGDKQEIMLFENETITQVSGHYTHYIRYLIFGTSRGRFLMVGQPTQRSFNMFPTHQNAELLKLSGRQYHGISSLGAHWGWPAGANINCAEDAAALGATRHLEHN